MCIDNMMSFKQIAEYINNEKNNDKEFVINVNLKENKLNVEEGEDE